MADDQKTVQVITQIESDATAKALEATGAIAKAKVHKNILENEKYAETLQNAQADATLVSEAEHSKTKNQEEIEISAV